MTTNIGVGFTCSVALSLFLVTGSQAAAFDAKDYPHPIATRTLQAQGLDLQMTYMDVAPTSGVAPNGKTVVLLHGKNFCGAAWEETIKAVTGVGYRAIVPDQIGFCRSSKPRNYHYSFHDLAANTRHLLTSLGIEKPILIGHSMGGMLGVRFALSFPDDFSGLVLVNPIGLEDWRAKGVPERTVDELFDIEKKTDAAKIKAYQQKVYYNGNWKPEYDRWVNMLAAQYEGPDGETTAWIQALASKMVFSDPIVHDLAHIKTPTTLLIGENDITAIGRDRVAPDVAATLGDYKALSRETAAKIKGANLVTFPTLGHAPQIEDPQAFHVALIAALARL